MNDTLIVNLRALEPGEAVIAASMLVRRGSIAAVRPAATIGPKDLVNGKTNKCCRWFAYCDIRE